MDTLRAMQVFIHIADAGSLSAAARQLGHSLPAVVRTLAALEAHLGVRLFNRTTRRIQLTDEGREYLHRSRSVLAAVQEAEAALRPDTPDPAGLLTVTAPVLFGQQHVAPELTALLRQHARLRCRMGWMGQQTHVFSGSVPRNIGLGRDKVSAAQIAAATQQAHLDEALVSRAGMSLGEGGAGLSGGEVVRLALARLAVREEAGLLLVDEPTAHLDPVTAAQIAQALRRMAKGRTLLVATHDAQLAAAMDRVIELPVLPLRPLQAEEPSA